MQDERDRTWIPTKGQDVWDPTTLAAIEVISAWDPNQGPEVITFAMTPESIPYMRVTKTKDFKGRLLGQAKEGPGSPHNRYGTVAIELRILSDAIRQHQQQKTTKVVDHVIRELSHIIPPRPETTRPKLPPVNRRSSAPQLDLGIFDD